MKTVSCIIPVYNESSRIWAILDTITPLLGTLFCEIVVVDDHSSDDTKNIVRRFKAVTLIEHARNEGKSKAIADGIRHAKGELILMIDGDLIGLEKKNIQDLVDPLLEGKADITISYRGNTPKWWIQLSKIETFSGERCFSKDFLIPHLSTIESLPGYGLETFMNARIIERKYRIASVPMKNVTIDYKWHKHGIPVGIYKEIMMWRDILWVLGPFKLARQVREMKILVTH